MGSSEDVTGFVQDSLEARSEILKTTLQDPQSRMRGLRDRVNRGAMVRELVLEGLTNQFQEAVLFFVLTQLFLEV